EVIDNHKRFRDLSREYAQLEPLVAALGEQKAARQELAEARGLAGDPGLGDMAAADIERLQARLGELDAELRRLLIPRDPLDDANLFLEIRAGTGGDEAALFAG